MRSQTRLVLAAALLGTLTSTARAEDKPRLETYLPDQVIKKDKDEKAPERKQGWDGSLVLGASSSFAQSSNVVGTVDGIAWGLGIQVTGGLDYLRGPHEWTSSLKLGETYTYTTALDQFVKTMDELDLRSTYLYALRRVPWLGPFAEVKLKMPLLTGYDVQAEYYDYHITEVDGDEYTKTRRRLRLSNSFQPLHLEESIGAFAKPIDKEAIRLEGKVGFGAKHIFAADQFAIDKIDKDAKLIEVKELSNVHQGGPAISLAAKGSLAKGKVSYNGLAEVMFPVVNNMSDDDTRNIVELTNVLMEAGLSFKLVSWASLDYSFRALREPQLIDKWQLQNNLLLTFAYTLIK